MRNLAFITTHIINKAVISEYKKMSKTDNIDCLLVIDNTNLKIETSGGVEEKEFFGTKVKCFFFDEKLNAELNLPYYGEKEKAAKFSEVMWYCSDYRYYYVKKFLPDYDFYWQFDFDVYFNGDSYAPFFEKYKDCNEDLLICDLRPEKRSGDWVWSHQIDWAYEGDVFGSFFPACRLSSKAIDFLYKKRVERLEQYLKYENKERARWLFGEVFVPTELIKGGFSSRSINEKYVSYLVWDKEIDLNEDRVFEHPDNLMYHPVKGQYISRIEKLKKENEELREKLNNTLGNKIKQLFSFK